MEGWNADFLTDEAMEKAIRHMKYLSSVTRLEKVNANIHLIVSEEIRKRDDINPRCWEKLTTKTSRVYNGWGMHREMLSGSDLDKNIMIIREILNGIAVGKN